VTFLSRLTLKRTPSAQALAALLNPADDARRIDAHHRLIWTAFAGDPAAKRDFLWREEGDGRFLVLSHRPPNTGDLFETPDVKPFEPALRVGDRLAFLLRANATRTVKTDHITQSGKREREHRDVVMELLRPMPKEERAEARMELAQQAAQAWLARVGARSGFTVETVSAQSYRVLEPPGRRTMPRFGILDLQGVICVDEPGIFLPHLTKGFGRAKAFGCGLMLIRRA
jgi:CRISPR system Cascade subunit CasE